ncbi:MAG: hypothetical protein WKF30_15285 [Pyrinomonadaceae bacterium]
MQINNKIKIIKRVERESRQEEAATIVAQKQEQMVAAAAEQSEQAPPRDAVTTITAWVDEIRKKKNTRAGAAHAFKNLFTKAA